MGKSKAQEWGFWLSRECYPDTKRVKQSKGTKEVWWDKAGKKLRGRRKRICRKERQCGNLLEWNNNKIPGWPLSSVLMLSLKIQTVHFMTTFLAISYYLFILIWYGPSEKSQRGKNMKVGLFYNCRRGWKKITWLDTIVMFFGTLSCFFFFFFACLNSISSKFKICRW